MILAAIYEPVFSKHSHGFRASRSCHTALEEIRNTWTGVKWLIEVDVRGFVNGGAISGHRAEQKSATLAPG